jgi:hypothetical protein
VDPDVALPYWDTTLDARLPNPRDSVLWTEELLGASDQLGAVIDGPFADFRSTNYSTIRARRTSSSNPRFLVTSRDFWNMGPHRVNTTRLGNILRDMRVEVKLFLVNCKKLYKNSFSYICA